jgi:hypothetical protein
MVCSAVAQARLVACTSDFSLLKDSDLILDESDIFFG